SPSVEQHGAASDGVKVVRDLEVVEETVFRENVFEQVAQPEDVPLAIAHLINQLTLSRLGWNIELVGKGGVGCADSQVWCEDDERIADRSKNGFGVIARSRDFPLAPFECIDIHQHEDRAVNLVFERQIRLGP